ncbi:MAG: tetratricopeptide repeat protein [Acidobacteria bacterium]|nr:tetratricopeptide repeat protein [Acidobacteriota bacterium]
MDGEREARAADLPLVTAPAAVKHVSAITGLALVTVLAFLPVLRNDFVNWDDPAVILHNQQLAASHVVGWAFTTTLIGHYQPLAWLAWSAIKILFGLNAQAFHAISLFGHLVNGILIYMVAWRLTTLAGLDPRTRRIAAVVAALAFAVHPVRVEAVAWASAFPYVLSLAPLLLAFLLYLDHGSSKEPSRSAAWLSLAIGLYAVSLLARAGAIGFPLVLLAVDVYPLRRRINGRVLLEKLPFIVVAVTAAVIESGAREIAPLQDVSIGARLTMAATSPFIYLGRTVFPVRLSPMDAVPISPTLDWVRLGLGVTGLAAIASVVWRLRRRWPALAVVLIAYVVFLAPVMGLTPSGLQATADRYMYLAGVVVSLLVGIAVARVWPRNRFAIVSPFAAVTVIGMLSGLTWNQTRWWHDSITLWTRAADLDPRNDIATYNLAIALAEAGREDEAMGRYEQTRRIVPDQPLARKNLSALQARRAEREGDRLVDAGHPDEAEQEYSRALALDSTRLHARAARGILLTRLGKAAEAAADLRAVYDADVQDAPVINALAFALIETGRPAEAATVLKGGVRRYPDDVNLAHNLARLLATAPDPRVRDASLALQLALRVRDRTGGGDPRALDTLAAAYAAAGKVDLARDIVTQALARARQLGDADLAAAIAAHARQFTSRK